MKKLLFLSIFFVVSIVGIYFRLYPLRHFVSDESYQLATRQVLNQLQQKIKKVAETDHGHIGYIERKKIIKNQFDTLLRNESTNVRKTIHKVAKQIDQKTPTQQRYPYLLAADSYYYYNLTENILNDGKISQISQGSKYLNPLMLAPDGHWEPLNFHPYIGYCIFRISSFIKKNITLMHSVAYTPLIISVVSLIPFLLICFQFQCSWLTCLISAMFFNLAPIYLTRSTWGWYDNDPYNIFFPLIILFFLFKSIQKSERQQMITNAILSALSIVLYAFFWHGWMFLLIVIMASGVFLFIFNLFIQEKTSSPKKIWAPFPLIFCITLLGITLAFGFKDFFILFQEGWIAFKNFLSPQLSLWPDLYIAVGELRESSLNQMITFSGGYLSFILAHIGALTYLACRTKISNILLPEEKLKNHATANLPLTIILFVFLITSFFAAKGAERFIILYFVPLSIFFALGLNVAFSHFQSLWNTFFNTRHQIIKKSIYSFVIISLILFPIHKTYQKMPSLLSPIYNDTWNKILQGIENLTPSDSIINTWWPPGHFIKAIAHRRVTFDGATINKPQSYWLANVFLSPNEHQSLGLLRFLNNGGNEAVSYLQNQGFKLSEAIKLIKSLSILSFSDARLQLISQLNNEQIDKLLNITHKKPPPSYLLIYNELVDKNIQLSFVGNWDFEKVEQINHNPNLHKMIPPSSDLKKYISFLWDISGGQPRFSRILAPLAQSSNRIIFEDNVKIDLINKTCQINSTTFGKGTPRSLFYAANSGIIEKKFTEGNLPYSVILFKRGKSYQCVLLDTRLARSTLLRLYFFEGNGFKYIQPFIKASDINQRTQIYVYQIDWAGWLKEINTKQNDYLY